MVLQLRGIPLRGRVHFYEMLRFARPTAIFVVERPNTPPPTREENIPEDRKRYVIHKKPGFVYKVCSYELLYQM